MDITKFVVSGRDKAKVFGDYGTYQRQLSNKINSLRRRLEVATKPRAKYSKTIVTAENIAANPEFVHLLILTSERAWANAMSMREIHSQEKNGITRSTRSHIVSRLHKATAHATHLFQLISEQVITKASDNDVLEARAYAASLRGAMEFEKRNWEACVRSYSEARVIYTALATSMNSDIFKDLVTDPVDPSIRYGAYQMRMPRTVPIPAIARKFFPHSDSRLVAFIENVDPSVLSDRPTAAKIESGDSGAAPKTIQWRHRNVQLEDAAISSALAAVKAAETRLSDTLSSLTGHQLKDRASAYDGILIASQDAVDASKHAIDELTAEGVGQGDKRMQSLQITRTALSYDMVSWRIGRNRVLVGDRDGATQDQPVFKRSKRSNTKKAQEPSTGQKVAHLRQQVVLYDAILQSLDSIKELPGVAGDLTLVEELGAKHSYFAALRCLAIARSHAIVDNTRNALALMARASERSNSASSILETLMDTSDASPPNIQVSPNDVQFLQDLLCGEVARHRALVQIEDLTKEAIEKAGKKLQPPLIERLDEYPVNGVDLKNIVTYPPRMEPVPVKPLFLDLAFNYIQYPGREVGDTLESQDKKISSATKPETQQKKGWFGFGGR